MTAHFFTALCAIAAGLCFGSFANVVIYRLPRGESIVSPPSRCPACGRRLGAAELIPVLSWFLLRGRCRWCDRRIPWRYPAVEAVCAAVFAAMTVYPAGRMIPLCALGFMMLCVFFIDADTQEIPDGLLVFGAAAGVIWVIASHFCPLGAPQIPDALAGAAAGVAPLLLIDRLSLLFLKKDGFGFGDVKLMAAAGLYLGWKAALTALLFAVVGGGVFGAFLLISRRAQRGTYLAFGPFLSVGVLMSLWFGEWFRDALFWGLR